MELQEVATQFNVSSVSQITINHRAGTVIGAVTEANLLVEIQLVLV